jgi:hypothetical protein
MPWDDDRNSSSIGFNNRGSDNRDGTRSMSREGWEDLRQDIQDRLADDDLDERDRHQLKVDRDYANANLRAAERAENESWAERNGHNQ